MKTEEHGVPDVSRTAPNGISEPKQIVTLKKDDKKHTGETFFEATILDPNEMREHYQNRGRTEPYLPRSRNFLTQGSEISAAPQLPSG